MFILGLVLLLIGWLTGFGIITLIGAILAIVGGILLLISYVGTPVGGRRYW